MFATNEGGLRMELILQKGLSHQQEAVDRINQVFKGVGIFESRNFYENPTIDLRAVSYTHLDVYKRQC